MRQLTQVDKTIMLKSIVSYGTNYLAALELNTEFHQLDNTDKLEITQFNEQFANLNLSFNDFFRIPFVEIAIYFFRIPFVEIFF